MTKAFLKGLYQVMLVYGSFQMLRFFGYLIFGPDVFSFVPDMPIGLCND